VHVGEILRIVATEERNDKAGTFHDTSHVVFGVFCCSYTCGNFTVGQKEIKTTQNTSFTRSFENKKQDKKSKKPKRKHKQRGEVFMKKPYFQKVYNTFVSIFLFCCFCWFSRQFCGLLLLLFPRGILVVWHCECFSQKFSTH